MAGKGKGRRRVTYLGGLDGAELARHLRDPEGAVGLAVIGGLAVVNAEGSAAALERLELADGMSVLELGCGLGDLVGAVTAAGDSVRYTGLDRSDTMVAAALERHGDAVATGRAAFLLGSSERMPFEAGSFDRVFSLGLIHFWTEPEVSLAELRRVMRPGSRMVMGCLGPERAPPFATSANGFLLRTADEWQSLCRAAGFARYSVEGVDAPGRPQGLLVIADR
jgi:ubiquinone/menaquinone biosynthesis C-methylase UbiE